MSKRAAQLGDDAMDGCFGFDAKESVSHFLVHVPTGSQHHVEISEHLSWDEEKVSVSQHYGDNRPDGQVRCRLARSKWNDIADAVRAEFNARLKSQGSRTGKWKMGFNPVARSLGKELTLLAWAIEDADPSLTRVAIGNWQGLAPEERWWLYTMTAAASGHATAGRGVGWRKAVRYALTENPLKNRVSDEPVVPEFFRLAATNQNLFVQPDPLKDTFQHPLASINEPIPELLPSISVANGVHARESTAKRSRAKKSKA